MSFKLLDIDQHKKRFSKIVTSYVIIMIVTGLLLGSSLTNGHTYIASALIVASAAMLCLFIPYHRVHVKLLEASYDMQDLISHQRSCAIERGNGCTGCRFEKEMYNEDMPVCLTCSRFDEELFNEEDRFRKPSNCI